MEKGKFYILKRGFEPVGEEGVYILLDKKKLDENFWVINIGKVHAILIDRVITSESFEFITDKVEEIFKNFKEISVKEARNKIDNTQALLSKQIFRR